MRLNVCCGKLLSQTEALVSTLDDAGFGLPFVERQFWSRVAPSALHGAVVLASFSAGWPLAAKCINDVQYKVAKGMLGL